MAYIYNLTIGAYGVRKPCGPGGGVGGGAGGKKERVETWRCVQTLKISSRDWASVSQHMKPHEPLYPPLSSHVTPTLANNVQVP